MTLPATFVSDIITGKHDDDLDRLAVVVRERQRTILRAERHVSSFELLRALKIGDTVRFNDKTRPAYMRGHTGTVQKINSVSATVVIDRDMGKFRAGAPIRVPCDLLEKAS